MRKNQANKCNQQLSLVSMCEGALFVAIKAENTAAIIYTLATLGKDRGYGIPVDELQDLLVLAINEQHQKEFDAVKKVNDEQSEVIKEAHAFIKKLKSRIIELENLVSSNATA